MANTIGSAPRPVSTSQSTATRATSQAPETAAPPKKAWSPTDSYTPADYAAAAKEPVTPGLKSTKTPDDISKMSNEDLGAMSPEEVTGMTMNQYLAYEKALDKEGGPGRDSLDPKLGMSIARKSFVNNMMMRMLAYRG